MRYLLPVLVALIVAITPLARALEPTDLSRILDAPDLSFSLESTIGTASESAEHSIAGQSSLKITPSFDAEQGKQAIYLKLKLAKAGPGRLSFQVRSTKADPRLFTVNSNPPYATLPEESAEDTWYPATFAILPEREEIVLSFSTTIENADAAFYLDNFDFQPGISIDIEDIPEAGAIQLSPQKDLYQVGENISVSLQPTADSISASITEIDTRFAISKDRPTSFSLIAEKDILLRASYRQTLSLPNLKASAQLVESVIDLEAGNTIPTTNLILEDLPANSVLAFDATLVNDVDLFVYGESSIPILRLESRAPRNDSESFPDQIIRFDFPVAKVEIKAQAHPNVDYAIIENLRIITDPVVLIQTTGLGSTSVNYEETATPGIYQATLSAQAETGWTFQNWTGDINSTSPNVATLIDSPRSTRAVFVQIPDPSTDDNDVAFELSAPNGSTTIVPLKETYQEGDSVTLSVNESHHDRFVAWSGDLYSTNPTVDLTLDQPTHIEAIFEQEIANSSPYAFQNAGTLLFPALADPTVLAFPSQTFAPKDWTEFSFPLDGPLAIGLTFEGYEQMSIRAWLDDRRLPEGIISTIGNTIFINSTNSEGGTLRIRITNTSETSQTFGLSKLGFYHDSNLWHDGTNPYHLIRPNYTITPEKRFHEIGSTVTLTPTPYAPQEFVSWDSPQLAPSDREYTLPDKGPILVKPRFEIAGEPDGIQILLNESSTWSLLNGISFTNSASFGTNEIRSLVLEASGPGVLVFKNQQSAFPIEAAPSSVDVEILDNGSSARYENFNITPDLQDREVLIDSGLHRIEILISLSDEAIANNVDVVTSKLNSFQFLPGYAVTSDKRYPQPLKVLPEQTPAVYAPGTSVTISDDFLWGSPFGSWTGDLAGSPSSVQLELDRHIVANPTESLDRQLDTLSSSISENARFSTIGYSSGIAYYVESKSGPTELTFEIPALTELSLNLGSINAQTKVIVNGLSVYDGTPENTELTIPVKETAQTILVQVDLDPSSDQQASIQAITYQSFQLTGYFEDQQEFVIPTPAKDSYAPGEKVTIDLGNGVDSDFVFYDVAIAYPTLNIIEWPDLDGKKSFEVEMSSHASLLGRIGVAPTRSRGDLVLGYDINLSATAEKTPDGKSATQATLLSDFSTLRIVTQGAKHLDFWIQLPIGAELIFNEIEINGLPFAIEGNGLWQKASLAVPENTNYLNAYLSATDQGLHFLISDISTQTKYGIQYLLTGNCTIQQIPAEGTENPGSDITLSLTPIDGFHFTSWGSVDEQSTTLVAKPNQTPFLLPTFEKEEDEEFITLAGYQFHLDGTTGNQDENSVAFQSEGDTLSAMINGPARVTYDVQRNGSVGLNTSLDGEAFYWNEQFPWGHQQQDLELLIPAGPHLLELSLAKAFPQSSDSATLTNLNIEAGAYLWFNTYQSAGSLSASSDQRFIPLGQSITITATPDYDYVFDSWQSDLGPLPATPQITLSPTDHSELSASFRYQNSVSLQGNDWEQISDPNRASFFLAKTVVEGPGYFKIHKYQSRSTGFSARIDGLLSPSYPQGHFNYLPIPAGKHRIELSSYSQAATLEASTTYTPGYLLLLTGEPGIVSTSPLQQAYLLGTKVSLTPIPATASAEQETFQIGDNTLTGNQNLEIQISGHTILPVNRTKSLSGSTFSSNASSDFLSIEPSTNGPTVLLVPTYKSDFYVEQTIQGPGTLSFAVDNLEPARLDLLVDGGTALTTIESGDYQLNLPPGRITLRWQVTTTHNPRWLEPVALSNISFQAENLTDYQIWLASKIPSHLFARGQNLAPENDLDLDGASNQEERENGTNPASYEMPAQLGVDSNNSPLLSFELPKSIEAEAVNILVYQDQDSVPFWKRFPLKELDYDSVYSPTSDTNRFELSTTQLGNQIKMVRVSIPTP